MSPSPAFPLPPPPPPPPPDAGEPSLSFPTPLPMSSPDAAEPHPSTAPQLPDASLLAAPIPRREVSRAGQPVAFPSPRGRHQRRTGDGPTTQEPLTDIEIRALSLVGDSNRATTGIGADPLTQDDSDDSDHSDTNCYV
uniref:cyclic AMP-dependent transcription factor ATF-5-like n=1 Tax=Pristiophorus japonicus TaxID=55135 RepID=UPI00398E3E28